MKTASQPRAISPSVVLLGLMAAGVVFVAAAGIPLPLLSNLKLSLAILLVIGMAACAQGGIGRVAALRQWTHPLSLLAYLLGGLILLLAAAGFAGWNLPLVRTPMQAIIVIALLSVAKIAISIIHSQRWSKSR